MKVKRIVNTDVNSAGVEVGMFIETMADTGHIVHKALQELSNRINHLNITPMPDEVSIFDFRNEDLINKGEVGYMQYWAKDPTHRVARISSLTVTKTEQNLDRARFEFNLVCDFENEVLAQDFHNGVKEGRYSLRPRDVSTEYHLGKYGVILVPYKIVTMDLVLVEEEDVIE